MLGADGSAVKKLPELTKQHAEPKRGAQCG